MVPAAHQPPSSTPCAAAWPDSGRRHASVTSTAATNPGSGRQPPAPSHRWRRRLAVAVGVAAVLVGGTAMPAAAHIQLQRSDPASGAVLRRSPAAITLEFSKPVEVAFTAVRVLAADGQAVKTGSVQRVDSQPGRIRVALTRPLQQGRHAVSYRVLATDGHRVSGSFGFTVRLRAATTPSVPAGGKDVGTARTPALRRPAHPAAHQAASGGGQPSDAAAANLEAAAAAALERQDPLAARLATAVRWLLFAGLVLLVGGAAFLLLVWPAGLAVRRVGWLLAGAAGATLAATAAGVVLQGATAAGLRLPAALDRQVLGATLTTRYGVGAAARVGLLLALLPLLADGARHARRSAGAAAAGPSRWLLLAAVPLLVGVLASISLAGHAGTGPAAPLGLAADGLHLAAVSVWLGGLALLLTAVLPRRDPVELRQVLPRFSRLAFAAVVVIVTTGLVQSWRQVATLDALAATPYGRLLLAKVTLVVVLLAAAAVSRGLVQRRLLPTSALVARADGPGAARLDPDRDTVARLRRSVGVEVAIAVAVLVLTTVLVATNPARQAQPAAAAAPATAAVR